MQWEWAGVFDLQPMTGSGTYTLVVSRTTGQPYPFPSVNCLILKTTKATAEGIEAVEEDAEALWEAAATNVSTVAAHTVVPLGNVYKLVIDTTLPVNTFTITVAEEGAYVMFLQHDAVELEGLAGHYFTTGDGTPMDPLAVEVGGHHAATTAAPLSSGQIMGLTVAATAVVASTSVVIFVLAMPVFHWARSSARMGAALNLINCFASGALLAASFLLIIPEAFVFIQSSELFWLRMLSVLPLYLNPQNTHSTRVTSLCPFLNSFCPPLLLFLFVVCFFSFPPATTIRITFSQCLWDRAYMQMLLLSRCAAYTEESERSLVFGASIIGGLLLGTMIHWCTSLGFTRRRSAAGTTETCVVDVDEVKMLAINSSVASTSSLVPHASVPAGDGASAAKAHPHHHAHDHKTILEEALEEGNLPALDCHTFCTFTPHTWGSVVYVILIGDFFHNFCDGIAIGVAFSACGPTFGWVVAGGALAHEVSQELADLCVMVLRGNMSYGAALTFNAISSVSCIIGEGGQSWTFRSPISVMLCASANMVLCISLNLPSPIFPPSIFPPFYNTTPHSLPD